VLRDTKCNLERKGIGSPQIAPKMSVIEAKVVPSDEGYAEVDAGGKDNRGGRLYRELTWSEWYDEKLMEVSSVCTEVSILLATLISLISVYITGLH